MAVVEQQRKLCRLKLQRMFHANRIIFRTSERISSPYHHRYIEENMLGVHLGLK